MRAFLFVSLCLLVTACFDEGDCILTASNEIRIDFFKSTAKTTADTLALDSILIPGKVTFIVPDTIVTTSLELPVDPTETEVEYVFYYNGGKAVDTLAFSYTTQTQVLSPNCGSYAYHNDLTLEHNSFKYQVKVVNPKLRIDFANANKPLLTNVEIFL